ncbi:MAG: hypothetical protein ACREP0_09340 [Rhodanobacteraceae bacterium]
MASHSKRLLWRSGRVTVLTPSRPDHRVRVKRLSVAITANRAHRFARQLRQHCATDVGKVPPA